MVKSSLGIDRATLKTFPFRQTGTGQERLISGSRPTSQKGQRAYIFMRVRVCTDPTLGNTNNGIKEARNHPVLTACQKDAAVGTPGLPRELSTLSSVTKPSPVTMWHGTTPDVAAERRLWLPNEGRENRKTLLAGRKQS